MVRGHPMVNKAGCAGPRRGLACAPTLLCLFLCPSRAVRAVLRLMLPPRGRAHPIHLRRHQPSAGPPIGRCGGAVSDRGGAGWRLCAVWASALLGCAGGGGCACCLAGGALVRDGAVSTGGAAAAAGKGPNNVILASASSDSSCTMRCAPRLLKAWMRSARWPCSNACSAVLVPAMLPCGAGPCGAVRGEGGGEV